MLYEKMEDLIGNTPLLRLSRLQNELALPGNLYAKIESYNAAGSVKDRVAKNMIDLAEKSGKLKRGGTILEATSGNTGIALAAIGAAKGYRVIIVMPENMSQERQKLIRGYGATLLLTEKEKGMNGAIERANELKKERPDYFIPDQFTNEANPSAHAQTGEEIDNDLQGKIDAFVAGVGTSGTLTGVARYFKGKGKNVKIIAVEPERSPVLSGGEKGAHNLQGIGAGFIPPFFDKSLVDEIFTAKEEDAYACARLLAKTEGILCGISSGAALFCAINEAKKRENQNKNIVVLFPDEGGRYLSTALFDE